MAGLDGTITITNSEYRPCIVDERKALFHKWCDNTNSLRAVVEYEDGSVALVSADLIRFLDSKQLFSEMRFE